MSASPLTPDVSLRAANRRFRASFGLIHCTKEHINSITSSAIKQRWVGQSYARFRAISSGVGRLTPAAAGLFGCLAAV